MATDTPPASRPARLGDPTLRQLASQRLVETPYVKALTRAQLAKAEPLLAAAPSPTVVMTLSARKPFGQRGSIDVYKPGRWDCESDQVFLDPLVVSSPGVWTGSVVYGKFTAPTTKKYLLVVHFYGADITLKLSGPFGDVTAHSFQNQATVATAQYQLSQGQKTWFQFNCVGFYLGFLTKIEMLRLP
jgi:hypothetical protein